jgi:AraC family transcriptional regulator, regulatory protein of adaptative response / DNA-3-methyladenine glycosylase II
MIATIESANEVGECVRQFDKNDLTPQKLQGGFEFSLAYKPPMDWQGLLDYYRSHQISGVETVSEFGYGRLFIEDGEVGFFWATNDASSSQIKLSIHGIKPALLSTVVQRVRRMFDLDMDPSLIEAVFRRQSGFGELWDKSPGLRVAKGWSSFETAIATILGQVVSVKRGRALIAQLVERYGHAGDHPMTGQRIRLFPPPETLATASMTNVGTTQKRRETIRALSSAVANGTIDLTGPQDEAELRKQLLAFSGIGIWSAKYIALRALGNTDAFPHTDLLLNRASKNHPELKLDEVRPWRSYAAVYFWKHFHSEPSNQPKDSK